MNTDLNSTKVIVDTASESDCSNDCPFLSLADYVARNGAYGGINGSYFCPAAYPSCAGKTNSFDTLMFTQLFPLPFFLLVLPGLSANLWNGVGIHLLRV